MKRRTVEILRQITPILIASLLGVSFGTMLGWPSATFNLLVDEELSPILITWDQSALIAGFLMEGNIIGTAFSSVTIAGSKTGVVLGGLCQIGGWLAMFFADSIYLIGVSRVLVGFGNGYGSGQLRIYAEESCKPRIYRQIMQYGPISINIGVVFTYVVGGFVSFRTLSLVCLVFPIVNVVLFAIIPKQNCDLPVENIKTIYKTNPVIEKPAQIGFIDAFRNRKIRNGFILLFFITFIPQYSGGAANIVYSRSVYIEALSSFPHLCSIIYSIVYLIVTVISIKYTERLPRKTTLIACCIMCFLLSGSVCLYFYFLKDLLDVSSAFEWSPLVLLCLFNIFHSMGVNPIPILLINDKFPKNARLVAGKLYMMHFCLSAVLSTKIFQVIFTYFGMHMAYVFLAAVSLGSALLAMCFFKETKHNAVVPERQKYCNGVDVNDVQPCRQELKNSDNGVVPSDVNLYITRL